MLTNYLATSVHWTTQHFPQYHTLLHTYTPTPTHRIWQWANATKFTKHLTGTCNSPFHFLVKLLPSFFTSCCKPQPQTPLKMADLSWPEYPHFPLYHGALFSCSLSLNTVTFHCSVMTFALNLNTPSQWRLTADSLIQADKLSHKFCSLSVTYQVKTTPSLRQLRI